MAWHSMFKCAFLHFVTKSISNFVKKNSVYYTLIIDMTKFVLYFITFMYRGKKNIKESHYKTHSHNYFFSLYIKYSKK